MFNFKQCGTWKIKMHRRICNNICLVTNISDILGGRGQELEINQFSPRMPILCFVLLIEKRTKRSSYLMRKSLSEFRYFHGRAEMASFKHRPRFPVYWAARLWEGQKVTLKEISVFLSPRTGFPGSTGVKNSPAKAGDPRDVGSIPGLGRTPRGGNGKPLQCSCLEKPRDRGAWKGAVHGVAESDTTEVT